MQSPFKADDGKNWSNLLHQISCAENVQSFYVWSQKTLQWIPQNNNQKVSLENQQFLRNYLDEKTNFIEKELKSVTFNVLFDFRSSQEPDKDRGHMKFSHQRYQAILVQLSNMQCDIITLNEVTRPFVKIIEQTDWIRKSYKISTLHDSTKSIRCFGNIILTKLNPLALHLFKVPNLPRSVPIGFFLISKSENKQQAQTKRSIVTFSSIHLTAYDTNYQRRQKQLTAVKKYLDSFNECVDQHILQGDMNFHSEKQNIVPQNHQLSDAWIQFYQIKDQKDLSQNPGYTFDSISNFFIRELYWGFEKRRMRLDRIFYTNKKEPKLTPVDIKIVFNEPIYTENAEQPHYNILKSGITFLGDKMKLNIFRNKQMYLFCSDHFGLQCKFQIND